VQFGFHNLTGSGQIQVVNATTIVIPTVPSSSLSIPVAVTVVTPISKSNPLLFTYQNTVPIAFSRTVLYQIYGPTTLTFGPDPKKLYVGTGDGHIACLTLNDAGDQIVESFVSTVTSPERLILGIAFDPMETSLSSPKVYFSHTDIFHGEVVNSSGGAINGKISIATGPNLDIVEDIITGLPVSDHE
jgi:hypothetical protein